jgi:molybdate transport system substrate-binding protein
VGNTRIRVALEIDPGSHAPIEYPLLLLGHDPPRPAAAAFFDYLRTLDAAEVFRRHGFGLAESPAQ